MSFVSDTLGDLESEFTKTRRMLACIPDDHFAWQPHAKSWTLVNLSAHLANIPWWVTTTITTDSLDLAGDFGPRPEFTTREQILEVFDNNAADAMTAVRSTHESVLRQGWTLKMSEKILWTRPRFEVIREFGIAHMGHHRGQLSVYLRLLDVPLPPIFGPTADDRAG
jgi:uncharacterized damage-inducible protein DinB